MTIARKQNDTKPDKETHQLESKEHEVLQRAGINLLAVTTGITNKHDTMNGNISRRDILRTGIVVGTIGLGITAGSGGGVAQRGGQAIIGKDGFQRRTPWTIISQDPFFPFAPVNCHGNEQNLDQYNSYNIEYEDGQTTAIGTRHNLTVGESYRFNSNPNRCRNWTTEAVSASFGPV